LVQNCRRNSPLLQYTHTKHLNDHFISNLSVGTFTFETPDFHVGKKRANQAAASIALFRINQLVSEWKKDNILMEMDYFLFAEYFSLKESFDTICGDINSILKDQTFSFPSWDKFRMSWDDFRMSHEDKRERFKELMKKMLLFSNRKNPLFCQELRRMYMQKRPQLVTTYRNLFVHDLVINTLTVTQ